MPERNFDREWRRVELEPAARVWDITANCGPEGDRVMVNSYSDRGSSFLTVAEAREIANALIDAAETTERLAQVFRAAERR